MKFADARIVIFAKAPVPGKAKTRLALRYGPRGAAGLYKTMLRRTLARLRDARLCPLQLWCAPDAGHAFFASCRRDYGVALRRQGGNDLGQRMDLALRQALGECELAVLMGGDCISLSPEDLHTAIDCLSQGYDAVLGPAEDGGYVLIGLREPCPPLFAHMLWGGNHVLAATRKRLRKAGLRWAELPPHWDVDRPEDVRRLKRRFSVRSYALPLAESPKDSVT